MEHSFLSYRSIFKALALTVCACFAISAAAALPSLKQSIDSAYILMGKTTALNIELLTNGRPDGRLMIEKDKFPPEVEISADSPTADTTDLGNNRFEVRQTLTLQSFDSGAYHLPPILYVVGNETIASNKLILKVIPVPVDTLTDIHPYADVADPGLKWYDRLPDWLVDYYWVFILVIIFGGLATWILIRYDARLIFKVIHKPIPRRPPYEVAVEQLEKLRAEHLCEQGLEREYYTRLTEILRVYLHDRFGINALEMTSSQIVKALETNESTRLSQTYVREVLRMADFVKFAQARPLPEDNTAAFNRALAFVDATKPIVEESSENEDKNPKGTNAK